MPSAPIWAPGHRLVELEVVAADVRGLRILVSYQREIDCTDRWRTGKRYPFRFVFPRRCAALTRNIQRLTGYRRSPLHAGRRAVRVVESDDVSVGVTALKGHHSFLVIVAEESLKPADFVQSK